MHECSGGSCSISCVHLLSPGGCRGRRDGEIILSVPRGSRASQSESGSSQILSFSPSSHLGNGNLYLQTVGAGGEREILKSSLLSPLPPSIPRLGLHALSLSSRRPFAHSSSARVHHSAARRSGSAGPLPHPLFISPALERLQRASVSNPLTFAHVFAFHGCW